MPGCSSIPRRWRPWLTSVTLRQALDRIALRRMDDQPRLRQLPASGPRCTTRWSTPSSSRRSPATRCTGCAGVPRARRRLSTGGSWSIPSRPAPCSTLCRLTTLRWPPTSPACTTPGSDRPRHSSSARQDCQLPDTGWGQLLLSRSHQRAGTAWTDTATIGEVRGLKHRGRADTRPVPAHPELVRSPRCATTFDHFQTGIEGHLFAARTGRAGVPLAPPYTGLAGGKTIYRVWAAARRKRAHPRAGRLGAGPSPPTICVHASFDVAQRRGPPGPGR